MTDDENARINQLTDLRQRAERTLRTEADDEPIRQSQNIENLIYELQVHQIELEMQNDELRQAQVKLSESRDQYSELYDFAPVGYMTIGVNGLIEQANLTSATLLGVSRAKLAKQPLSRFVFPADQDLLYQHRRRIFAEPQTLQRIELRLMQAGTTPFYAQLESKAANIQQGGTFGYRTIVSDISARKQSEAALLASNQRLTTTLEELHTTQATLVQQERLAAVGQLTTGIAHDFNNILAIINNYTALLLHQAPLETNTRGKLNIIKDQTASAAKLVQQMLDFSRKSTSTQRVIEVRSFLINSVELLAHTLPANIRLKLQHAEDGCFVSVDDTQLQQVLINLVNNARDAMPDGGTVNIDLAQLDISPLGTAVIGPGKWALITVTDSGPGIPPEVLAHIFEPFFTTKGSQGSGLGLAQVYGIIKQHGGEVEVVTRVGTGTSFILYVPRLSAAFAPVHLTALSAPIQPAQVDPLSPSNGETILIVDDNELLRETTAALLEFMGYHVLNADTGIAALKVYLQQRLEIALVITDLTMPNMNGIELTNALRQINPRLKVIIATGYQPDTVAKDQLNSGEVIWLQKPIPINLLRRTVIEMIQSP